MRALVPLGLTLWCLAGCASSPPSRADTSTELPTLERFDYAAETGRVSALHSGDAADAPAIVYVHGTPGDATNWDDYLVVPVRDADSVALDRPGFGDSEPDEAVTSLVDQASALLPLLEARPVLVGHSLGGPVIAMAAALWPDRVAGLVIIAGSLDPDLEELRWYNRVGSLFDGVLSRALSNSNAEILALRPELESLAQRLDRVRCPVVLVHGTDDDLVPFANVAFMEQAFGGSPSVRTVALEGADHFLIWRDETEPVVREAIASLLD